MKLQDYLTMNARFTRMQQKVDLWAIDYSFEKLVPLIEDGHNYDDIADFILTRFDNFVQNGKLDQILEDNKNQKGEK